MPLFVPSIFRHEQTEAASVWTITHNLGGNGGQGIPVVDVYVTDNGQTSKILPAAVTLLSKQTVQLTFSTDQVGFAIVLI